MIGLELKFYFLRHDVIGEEVQFLWQLWVIREMGLLAWEGGDGLRDEVLDIN